MFQVVSINIRQDVMARITVMTGLNGLIAEKLVELATVSILLNFMLRCHKFNVNFTTRESIPSLGIC